MSTRIPALFLGSALLFHIPSAAASTVDWSSPESRDLKVSWSSQSAEALQARLAVTGPDVYEDGMKDERVGPTGGVLLHRYNDIHIELQPGSGLVRAVRVTEDGTYAVRRLFDAFAAGPAVFNPSQDAQVLVTFSVGKSTSGRGLLEAENSGTKVHFQFDVVIYEGGADGAILDQVSLSFDAATLKPTIRSKDAKSYTDPASSYVPFTGSYWDAAAESFASKGNGKGKGKANGQSSETSDLNGLFYTPTSYWDAAADALSWDCYWCPPALDDSETSDAADPTLGTGAEPSDPATPSTPSTPDLPSTPSVGAAEADL